MTIEQKVKNWVETAIKVSDIEDKLERLYVILGQLKNKQDSFLEKLRNDNQ